MAACFVRTHATTNNHMGWSFRKSKSFGPFRLNFSSSGIGMSFGVKGARISVNKRGTYVNLGTNGIYYRQRLGSRKSTSYASSLIDQQQLEVAMDKADNELMNSLTDAGSQSFVDELESRANKISLLRIFLWTAGISYFVFYLYLIQSIAVAEHYKDFLIVSKSDVHIRQQPNVHSQSLHMVHQQNQLEISNPDTVGWLKVIYQSNPRKEGFIRADMGTIVNKHISTEYQTRMQIEPRWKTLAIAIATGILAGAVYFYDRDKKRMSMELTYTMDGELKSLHEKFLQYFREFASSARVWQQLSYEEVTDKRRNAGASVTVRRHTIKAWGNHRLPSQHLTTNVSVPFIELHDRQIYFFPERMIVKKGRQLGGVFYKHIHIDYADSKFIETETPSLDATVVDHTWEYLNKNGDPDRRFSSNRRLPICTYSQYTLTSDQGWKEVFITSRRGAMNQFADFIRVIGEYQRKLDLQ